ncbi:HNH endonuclease [Citrobacter braakii]|uniref:HNH endonuclease n=1 Tax=Citrobacter braakii TaxID=57706 RepID=UPI0024331650|nr:HNH endonuclease signature motif containing protein [Citrobacter braakii]WFV19470.1 HNH endonuclease [Citrobacter braakii]
MVQQAWSFKAIEQEDLRYWGNDGYHDDSSLFYRYDSFVANHKNVKNGDVVIITNRENVLGVSVIEKIETQNINKKRNKCIHPDCNAKKILPRKTIKPEWRCDNGHEFDAPRVIFEPAIEFVAIYGNQFRELSNITMSQLITETPRYNGQMSIQEVNLQWAFDLVNPLSSIVLDLEADEADKDVPALLDEDQRQVIERQIKKRRGQKTFRDQLLKSNPVCAVTGCMLVDILEAAHIDAYRNDSHNHISNGLLLRSDIHTLYDLNHLAIDPDKKTLHFSKKALSEKYREYEGLKIGVKHELSKSALSKRWALFIKSSECL